MHWRVNVVLTFQVTAVSTITHATTTFSQVGPIRREEEEWREWRRRIRGESVRSAEQAGRGVYRISLGVG